MKRWLIPLWFLVTTAAIGQPINFAWDRDPNWNNDAWSTSELLVNGVSYPGLVGQTATIDIPLAIGQGIDANVRTHIVPGTACGDTAETATPEQCPPSPSGWSINLAVTAPDNPTNVTVTKTLSSGGSVMAAPTFIGSSNTTWNSSATPRVTASIGSQSGDILVAFGASENGQTTLNTPVASPVITWTLQQSISLDWPWCTAYLWTAVATGDHTVSFSKSAGELFYGGSVQVWRGSDGIGASVKGNVDGAAPNINITTTQDDSAIAVFNSDWNALTGTVTPRTGAGPFTQTNNYADGAAYGIHTGYNLDTIPIGTYAVGYTAPTGQKYSLIAIEVKGSSATATAQPPSSIRQMFANLTGM